MSIRIPGTTAILQRAGVKEKYITCQKKDE
jgi:hypothetical protein